MVQLPERMTLLGKGFIASRINMAYLTTEKGANSLQNKMKANMKSSMKNSADISILHTAIKQQIDYLVTEDKEIKKILDSFKLDIITYLQVIDSNAFVRMLPLV